MPNIKFYDPGSDGTADLTAYPITSGTVASATDQFHFGSRSVKCSTSNPAVTAFAGKLGTVSNSGARGSFWFRFDTTPDANAQIFYILTSSQQSSASISLTTGRLLRWSWTGAVAISGTTVLSVNTWYRVAWAYVITSSTSFTAKVWVNGNLELTNTDGGTLTNPTSDGFRLNLQAASGTDDNAWFDDIYIDDGNDLRDPIDNGTTPGHLFRSVVVGNGVSRNDGAT